MADAETQKARKQTHAVLDAIWKSGRASRGVVYARLSDAFGHQVHVGESDIETCQDIVKTLDILWPVEGRLFN